MSAKKKIKKIARIIAYLVGSIVLVIACLLIFINTPYGKKVVRNKLVAYLQQKLHTRVSIASVDYSLPKWIILKGIYVEDQHKDTLLYGGRVAVDLKMIQLIRGNTFINKVELEDIYANISKQKNDSSFNFQFIIDAFASPSVKPTIKDTGVAKITLREVALKNIRLRFADGNTGNTITSSITNLNTSIKTFNPGRMQFDVDKFTTDGVNFTMTTEIVNQLQQSPPSQQAQTASTLLVTAGLLDIRNVNAVINNKVTGLYYSNTLQHLLLTDGYFDLAKQNAGTHNLQLDSSVIQYVTPGPVAATAAAADTSTSASNWNFTVSNLSMKNNSVKTDDNAVAVKEGLDFSHIDLNSIFINAKKIRYSKDSITASVDQLSFKDKNSFRLDTAHAVIVYTKSGISAMELYVKTPQSLLQNAVSIKYDDIKQLTAAPQNTVIALKLYNSRVAMNDLYFLIPSIKKQLPPQKFSNEIIQLNTAMQGTLQQLEIPYLQVNGMSGSNINAKATLYNITDSNRRSYNIAVVNTRILKTDLLKFIPANKAYDLSKIPAVINLNTHVTGDMKNMAGYIDVNSADFAMKGKVAFKNIQNPKSLNYDVAIQEGRVEKQFLLSIIPQSAIPESIDLPATSLISGTAKGDMNKIQTALKLGGSYGAASLTGSVTNFKNKENARYDLKLTTANFQLGKLLKQDSVLGAVTLSAIAKGRGFNYKTMQTDISTTISSTAFKKYTYQNIELNTTLMSGVIKSNGSINDPSAKINYQAEADVKGDYPAAVKATVRMDTIQLQKLHLYKDSLNIAGNININAPNLDPAHLDGIIILDTMQVVLKNIPYYFDSIVAKGKTDNNTTNFQLTSPLADVTAKGKFEYNKIGSSIIQYINTHYKIAGTTAAGEPQQITVEGELKKHPFITALVPQLVYDNIHFKGSYTAGNNDSTLYFTADIPKLQYQENKLTKAAILVKGNNRSLSGDIDFTKFEGGNKKLYATSIHTVTAGDSIVVDAVTKDAKGKERFVVGVATGKKEDMYTFSVKDTLVLNYQKWQVISGNRLSYSPRGILAQNFILSNGIQKISVASISPVLNSPAVVHIENFDIRDVTTVFNSDTLFASGVINGEFTVSEWEKKLPAFTGHLELAHFFLLQQPVGTITFTADKKDDQAINASAVLTENGNDVKVKGTYYLNNATQQFDANMDIAKLNMVTVQAFSKGNLTGSSGSVKGQLAINGTFAAPHWKGAIEFDTTRFAIAKLGTAYSLDKQTINLDYPTITLHEFTIKDKEAHTATIDGTLTSNSISDYDMSLRIHANNFTLVDAQPAVNSQAYGFAAVDADISVTGNIASPEIEGDITVQDKTDVTIVLPESNINQDAGKVVRFISRDSFALLQKGNIKAPAEQKTTAAQFFKYNVNASINKKATLTIIIDPSTGDAIRVKGDAQLNAGVDPAGDIVLAGNYELNSGYYIMHYQFLERQFNLLPGSTITFSGPPTSASVNISAAYTVNTSAKDLLGNEVGDADPKIISTFNQKIPFRVILYLKGPIKKPEISFSIELPDENTNTAISNELRATIENKLAQLHDDVAATDKQVFSLLLLNRFAGEQSTDFFNGGGSNFNDMARESVSRFLSSALDQIASDLIKGVDIDLNVNSYQDFSNGDPAQKTDLNVAVSKNFLNDRLTVTVGKNFGIEGQDAGAKTMQKSNSIIPDVTVNYKLTSDGKYMIRAYKKDQFEVILDGYVVETGVAFVLTLDYDKFKELFRKKTK